MIVMKHFDLGEIPEIQKVGVYAIHNKINDKPLDTSGAFCI